MITETYFNLNVNINLNATLNLFASLFVCFFSLFVWGFFGAGKGGVRRHILYHTPTVLI